MKNVKVTTSALEIRNASLLLGKQLQAVKLTKEQAMAFCGKFPSFEDMAACYGYKNILHEGEFYDGYIAVYYSSWKQDVVKLLGKVQKCTDAGLWDYQRIEACRKGILYQVVYPLPNGTSCQGGFSYVWTFDGCCFERHAKWLQEKGLLPKETNPEELDKSLKRKLIGGAISNSTISLSDEENIVLETYAPDYYRRFFTTL